MDVRFVVCGHGGFGTGLHGALRLLCGEDSRVSSLDFCEGDSFDELVEHMEELVAGREGAPIIICTDVRGGSPYKASLLMQMKHPEVHAVTGVNFPLLMELMFPPREFENAEELVSHAVLSARAELTCVEI